MRYLLPVLVAFFASSAAAMEPIPGEERFEGLTGEDKNNAGGELGFGQIDEDFFLNVTLRTALNLGKVGVGLQVPLNLRVWDRDPENDNDYGGAIRREDWDEYGEWLRVLRYVRYGHKHSDDLIYARVGEIAAEIGHGTIMTRYLNNIDSSSFRLGSQLDLNTWYGGIETVIADWGGLTHSEHPWSKLVGGRIYVKPLAFIGGPPADAGEVQAAGEAGEGAVEGEAAPAKQDEGGGRVPSALNILAVGFSLVTDINAPRNLERDAATDQPVLVGERLQAHDTVAQTVYGFDVEVQALNTSIIKITPYSDLNVIDGAGWGWHLGTLVTLRMPIALELTIPIRLEYRRFAHDYIPAYFSTFYELERFAYLSGAKASDPKALYVRNLGDGDGLNGYYGDLAFDVAGLVQVGAIYEGYEGTYPNLAAFLNVPALETVQFKGYYTRTHIEDAADLFALDERSMLIAQVRYQLYPFLYLVGQWSRRWELVTDASKTDYGTFQPEDNWKAGVELGFDF